MEEIRGAAMAYYANLSEYQRQSCESFTRLLDRNGDRKVTFREYMEFIKNQGYNHVPPNLFNLLEQNNRGYLDFEECVTLFYMITCNRFAFCGGHNCNSHLLGIYFQCVECYRVGKKTFNLCSTCYRDTNFNHEHSDFLDNYDLLNNKPREAKNRMEEFSKTAELYYKRSSLHIQENAKTFFESLDSDNDKKICLDEFLGCVSEGGHVKMSDRRFFEALDKDRKGYLEFMEVMGICYINKSGRPFCGLCGEFIPGMYFTCSKCFDDGNNTFSLCPKCFDSFEDGKLFHAHDQFLDNYALLEAKRLEGIANHSKQQKPSTSLLQPSTSFTIAEDRPASTTNQIATTIYNVNVTNNTNVTNNAVVPHTKPQSKWGIAFKVLELALNGAAAGGLCTIM